jgi:hypothetical protein
MTPAVMRSRIRLAAAIVTLTALSACGGHPAAKKGSPAAAAVASTPANAEPAIPRDSGPAPEYQSTPATAKDDVLTYHNNPARTGLQPNESILTPANVNPATFGRQFGDLVDGFVNAQPLYVAGVSIPGKGRRNVVYVATENDSVYAFDADRPSPPLWHVRLLDGGTPVTGSEVNCGQIVPRIGITSTPVIDPSSGTLYVVAMVRHGTIHKPTYEQQLHALDIATGAEKFGGPVTIAGSAAGNGAGSVKGKITFDAFSYVNRAGLALANGVVYIGFASHCDLGDYHGWLFGYDAKRLTLRASFNVTPNGAQGAIWESGDAPAVDSKGNLYVLTGNGTFDAASGGHDYGDSFLKLAFSGNGLRPIDFFTPFDQEMLSEQDLDVGSGGAILLPDLPGPHRHLIAGAGKNAILYVVDRDHMGKYRKDGNAQIVQELRGKLALNFSTPAFWNGHLYIGSVNQPLQSYQFAGGRFSPLPTSQSAVRFIYPGATPAVSSDGDKNAIVWALLDNAYISAGPTVLYAFDATDLSRELYSSAHDGPGENGDPAVKFTTPTIAHGRVYFGTENHLDVYGLLH